MDGLNKKYGVDIVRVPYRSGNEVMTALLSGATPITLLGLVQHGPDLAGRQDHGARGQLQFALAAVSRRSRC